MKHPGTLIREALRPFFHKPAPRLKVDEGLVLQELRTEDIDRLFHLIETNRGHLQKWLSWIQRIKTRDHCRAFINHVSYRNIFAGKWVYGVWYHEQLVGLIDFNEGNKQLNQVSIGYWLGRPYEGKGIMTRAVGACLDYAFDIQHLHKVLIKCASDNFRSQAIPIRLRFTWEGLHHDAGTVNGREVDMIIYSMVYRDWSRVRELPAYKEKPGTEGMNQGASPV
jgi:ribosomal-protein-serine acetyltransferase